MLPTPLLDYQKKISLISFSVKRMWDPTLVEAISGKMILSAKKGESTKGKVEFFGASREALSKSHIENIQILILSL